MDIVDVMNRVRFDGIHCGVESMECSGGLWKAVVGHIMDDRKPHASMSMLATLEECANWIDATVRRFYPDSLYSKGVNYEWPDRFGPSWSVVEFDYPKIPCGTVQQQAEFFCRMVRSKRPLSIIVVNACGSGVVVKEIAESILGLSFQERSRKGYSVSEAMNARSCESSVQSK